MMSTVKPLEFSRPFALEGLEGPKTVRIEADTAERAHLAARFGLDGLDRLVADITVTPKRAGREIRVEGQFEATVRQTCGLTLVPLENAVSGAVDAFYSLDIEDEFSDLEDEEGEGSLAGPDPWPEGGLDLGELTAEALALGIDPFPRAPGAEFEAAAAGSDEAEAETRRNPFAALEKLKKSKDFSPENDG